MKTAGIIAEYNPFHNGHKYHIDETRRLTGSDYIIAVMSGDFVQRGAPAVLDKFLRTKMALENGVDLVIELPAIAALSSAEGFATGGVCLLDSLGVTDTISFGCEAAGPDIDKLQQIAGLLANETFEYKQALSAALKEGMSFPKARQHAVDHCLGTDSGSLLSGPNNILALEYLKAIIKTQASLDPVMITRSGNAYHDTSLGGPLSSATAIREILFQGNKDNQSAKNPSLISDTSCSVFDFSDLRRAVPDSVYPVLINARKERRCLSENAFSDVLFHALLEKTGAHSAYEPSNTALVARMHNQLENYSTWTEFAALLKTKNQTYTAISRSLAHILLNIGKDDFSAAATCSFAPYARVLGFRKSASGLLTEINQKSKIPVITRLASAVRILNTDQKRLFDLNLRATALYQYIRSAGSDHAPFSEYRRPLIYL